MDRSLYQYIFDNSGRIFSFSSTGGREMDKVVLFIPTAYSDCYSITLGDLQIDGSIDVNERGGSYNAEFVLSTVAKVIAFFLSDFPGAEVIIEGSTPARTRLYQIAISREMDDLGRYFDVYGVDGDTVEIFRKGRMYRSFAITVKSGGFDDNF